MFDLQKQKADFEKNGIVVVKNVLRSEDIIELKKELEQALEEDIRKHPNAFDLGMVHNCMTKGTRMANILDNETMHQYLDVLFSPTCILYAYQASSIAPFSENYGARIHTDSPRLIPNYDTNVGIIFPLDDFTLDNGATWYLAGSQNTETVPDSNYFYSHATRACCNAGDMIIFKARLIHAAGKNNTSNYRHALTLNLCRSFMRQRFDFPRLCSPTLIESLGKKGKRLLGMDVRMPTSIDEFYLPEDQRLYKANQG